MPAPSSNCAPVGEPSGRLSATSRPFVATARSTTATAVFDVLVMTRLPQHVAIIMDGNGRWAERRGLARGAGHRAGAEAVRRVVRGAREIGIPALTLYAFSAQNWERPPAEVGDLMRLLRTFLLDECAELMARGIRLTTIGDEARLPRLVRGALAVVERATRRNRAMTLCLALSYGGARGDRRRRASAGRGRGARRPAPGRRSTKRASPARSTRASCRRWIC